MWRHDDSVCFCFSPFFLLLLFIYLLLLLLIGIIIIEFQFNYYDIVIIIFTEAVCRCFFFFVICFDADRPKTRLLLADGKKDWESAFLVVSDVVLLPATCCWPVCKLIYMYSNDIIFVIFWLEYTCRQCVWGAVWPQWPHTYAFPFWYIGKYAHCFGTIKLPPRTQWLCVWSDDDDHDYDNGDEKKHSMYSWGTNADTIVCVVSGLVCVLTNCAQCEAKRLSFWTPSEDRNMCLKNEKKKNNNVTQTHRHSNTRELCLRMHTVTSLKARTFAQPTIEFWYQKRVCFHLGCFCVSAMIWHGRIAWIMNFRYGHRGWVRGMFTFIILFIYNLTKWSILYTVTHATGQSFAGAHPSVKTKKILFARASPSFSIDRDPHIYWQCELLNQPPKYSTYSHFYRSENAILMRMQLCEWRNQCNC